MHIQTRNRKEKLSALPYLSQSLKVLLLLFFISHWLFPLFTGQFEDTRQKKTWVADRDSVDLVKELHRLYISQPFLTELNSEHAYYCSDLENNATIIMYTEYQCVTYGTSLHIRKNKCREYWLSLIVLLGKVLILYQVLTWIYTVQAW